MKKMLLYLCLVAVTMGTKAQIGYQISLLNTATGEPRANETVTVNVSLSNNANEVFYSETKSATTNDFGVLSLSIGNADTFKGIDLSKMPFFIEVTANGVMIGKSQMLSVPVAEVAKRVAPIDKNLIVGKWSPAEEVSTKDGYATYTFYDDFTCKVDVYGYNYESKVFYICDTKVVPCTLEGTNVYVFAHAGYEEIYNGLTVFKYLEGSLYECGEAFVKL